MWLNGTHLQKRDFVKTSSLIQRNISVAEVSYRANGSSITILLLLGLIPFLIRSSLWFNFAFQATLGFGVLNK